MVLTEATRRSAAVACSMSWVASDVTVGGVCASRADTGRASHKHAAGKARIIGKEAGQLKLLNLTQKLQDLLTITKLLTVFDVYESEAEALNSFK